jgi:hypothetical protein
MAWLGLIETGSILIREKHKHLSKMSDRVSRNVLKHKRSRIERRECFIEVYIDNQSLFIIVYIFKKLQQVPQLVIERWQRHQKVGWKRRHLQGPMS